MNTKFLQRLSDLKSELGKISKDATNPFFKSKYFDVNSLLEHIEPLCQKNKLVLLQPIRNDEVFTQIIDVETGDMIESGIKLPAITDPQKIGSAITYYRRYSLQSLLGLQAEDDDANKASGKTPTKSKPKITDEQVKKKLNEFDNIDQFSELKTSYELTPSQLTEVIKKFKELFPNQSKKTA